MTETQLRIEPWLPPMSCSPCAGGRSGRGAACARERRYAVLGHAATARAHPSPAATQTRQARGRQEFNGTWHSKLYNTFTEDHASGSMYTLRPFPTLLA